MPGWNGSGTFVLPYSMVAEAAAGVKILASHQDTQWNAIKAGLELCQTRDGQNSPAADINWGGFRITNLADPVDASDAVNKQYVTANVNQEWVPEVSSLQVATGASFKVLGVNATSRYTIGRRLKLLHNSGGTTSYATVVSSSFSTDTTVVVAVDGGTSLSATMTSAWYGLLQYANPAYLDPRSAVMGYIANAYIYTAVGTSVTIPFDTELFDAQSEFDTTTHRFTPQKAGYYWISARAAAIGSGLANVALKINLQSQDGIISLVQIPASVVTQVGAIGIFHLAKGEYVSVEFKADVACTVEGTSSGQTLYDTCLNIGRVA